MSIDFFFVFVSGCISMKIRCPVRAGFRVDMLRVEVNYFVPFVSGCGSMKLSFVVFGSGFGFTSYGIGSYRREVFCRVRIGLR